MLWLGGGGASFEFLSAGGVARLRPTNDKSAFLNYPVNDLEDVRHQTLGKTLEDGEGENNDARDVEYHPVNHKIMLCVYPWREKTSPECMRDPPEDEVKRMREHMGHSGRPAVVRCRPSECDRGQGMFLRAWDFELLSSTSCYIVYFAENSLINDIFGFFQVVSS